MKTEYLNLLKAQFNNRIDFREKRPGILQLIAPFYHEDGDMVDVFLEESPVQGRIRICDHGITLMRLSYSYDIDTPNKEEKLARIISENKLNEQNGNIYLDVPSEHLYYGVMQFVQTIAKISNMRLFKRELVQSFFYDMLTEFVDEKLAQYMPRQNFLPIPGRDDLEVDYSFNIGNRPIFLFGVKDAAKARLTTICCLEFQKVNLPFRSVVVHEEFDNLPKKDRSRLTSAVDKQFVTLDDFQKNGEEYLKREIA